MAKPKLRFPQFNDAWESKPLHEYVERVTRKNKDNETDRPLTISSLDGLVDQRTYFNKTVASKDMSGYFLLKNGEFAYNKSYSVGYDYGSIKRLDDYDCGALSTLYICFRPKSDDYSDYLATYFDSLKWNPEVAMICAEGARNHGLLNVPINEFFNIKIRIPTNKEERDKISSLIFSVDAQIKKRKGIIADIKRQKQGLMQNLFFQKLRFHNNESEYPDWQTVTIGDIFSERSERSVGNEELLSVTIGNGILRQSDSDKRDISSDDKSNYKKVYKGDLAYNSMRMWQGAEGVSEYDGIVSPAYTVLVPIRKIHTKYFEYFFKTTEMLHIFTRYSQGLTSDTWNLKYPVLSKIKITIPSYEEQIKIADAITIINKKIEIEEAILEDWQKIKRGLLQQMFV